MQGVIKEFEQAQRASQITMGSIRTQRIFRWPTFFIVCNKDSVKLVNICKGLKEITTVGPGFKFEQKITTNVIIQVAKTEGGHVASHYCICISNTQVIIHQLRVSPSIAADLSSNLAQILSIGHKINQIGPFELACLDDPLPLSENNVNHTADESSPQEPDQPKPGPTAKDHHLFHSHIRIREFDSEHALQTHLERNLNKYKCQYGVLLFLYSVILTKGVSMVQEEMGDLGESMIDNNEGHGSQALINLLISGRATPYVWDGDKDVGGMSLVGIARRPAVGFLTRLEHLRYVQVGWYLKNPTNPVWILGSETHLTVLFSWSKNLVTPDSEVERAKQVFSWYDTEGNHFIPRDKLKEVLEKLNLCTDDDFIQFMCKELDPENMGVILYHKFVEAFFTPDESYKPPDTFTVYHYNGLESSCPQNKIQFAEICVTLQESHVGFSPSNNSEFLSCLTTKWPNLDVIFNDFIPSLN
ncbi:unnamed protein product [Meganyctiphanes norvegica]|uniref:Ubiquitin carboxyl-terminal hydrolase MINDY n=1 Tax=Meganyctiphanes norvegica TaxID=48144 RepID=A0AAV2RSY8_MEGNR